MMGSYATIDDIMAMRGPQSAEDMERLEKILPVISSQFRLEARHYGKDLDQMAEADPDLAEVTKCLVIDASMTYLYSSKETEAPQTQWAQSAMGYSISGTYVNPGGGLYSKRAWLKLLGITRQKVGRIDIFDFGGRDEETDKGNTDNTV